MIAAYTFPAFLRAGIARPDARCLPLPMGPAARRGRRMEAGPATRFEAKIIALVQASALRGAMRKPGRKCD